METIVPFVIAAFILIAFVLAFYVLIKSGSGKLTASHQQFIRKQWKNITEESFNNEDNCYYLGQDIIKYKSDNLIETLETKDDEFIYESIKVKVIFDRTSFELKEIKEIESTNKEITLNRAAEMIYLLKNLNNFSIFAN